MTTEEAIEAIHSEMFNAIVEYAVMRRTGMQSSACPYPCPW
jgi:hypothetical protein